MKTGRRTRGFTLIELMIVVAIVGILAVIAVTGVRRYLANAKSAEARNGVGAIGKAAAIAFDRPWANTSPLTAGTADGVVAQYLCLSASEPVPVAVTTVSGRKFQASNAAGVNYHKDDNAVAGYNAMGFACLRYEVQNPQAYQYNYTSDSAWGTPGTVMTATAIGDLNGDGVTSKFELVGGVQSKALVLAPSIAETNPDE